MRLFSFLSIAAICLCAFTATAQLPKLVKDINVTGDSKPANLTNYNNHLYFSASDGVNGTELWVTDGTDTGTKTYDLYPGMTFNVPNSSTPHAFTEYKNKLYFTAATNDTTYGYLWAINGTDTPVVVTTRVSMAQTGYVYNNLLYFQGLDTSGAELWVTDGTDAGTRKIKDIWPGFRSSSPDNFIAYNNTLYFSALNGVAAPHSSGGKLVYVTDGTDAGTHPVDSTVGLGVLDYDLPGFTIYKGRLYFQGDNGQGWELWSTDGTHAGTQMVKLINQFSSIYGDLGAHAQHMTVYGSKMYFAADDGPDGLELWVTDGTTAGTQLYQNIYPDHPTYGVSSYPTDFIQDQGLLFFQAWDASGANWMTLDTPTHMAYPVYGFGNPGGMNYSFLPVIYNGSIYIRAVGTINGGNYDDLFALDSIIPHRLRPAGNVVDPNKLCLFDTKQLIISNGKLFYTADYDANGLELYALKTDTVVPPPNAVKNVMHNLSASLYPNPAGNEVYVNYTLSQPAAVNIQLYDITGRIKTEWQQDAKATGSNVTQLTLPANIAPGLYFVRISAAGSSATLKLSIIK